MAKLTDINAPRDLQGEADPVDGTTLVLGLALAQVQLGLQDSEKPVATLSETITVLHRQLGQMSSGLAAALQTGDTSNLDPVLQACTEAQGHIQQAVVAMQFYDKLSQRLGHICDSLEGVAEWLRQSQGADRHSHWQELLERIRASYTMEDEKALFDRLVGGGKVEEALDEAGNSPQGGKNGDVELF